eukprot:3358235-Amphidinium_carterae.2
MFCQCSHILELLHAPQVFCERKVSKRLNAGRCASCRKTYAHDAGFWVSAFRTDSWMKTRDLWD